METLIKNKSYKQEIFKPHYILYIKNSKVKIFSNAINLGKYILQYNNRKFEARNQDGAWFMYITGANNNIFRDFWPVHMVDGSKNKMEAENIMCSELANIPNRNEYYDLDYFPKSYSILILPLVK